MPSLSTQGFFSGNTTDCSQEAASSLAIVITWNILQECPSSVGWIWPVFMWRRGKPECQSISPSVGSIYGSLLSGICLLNDVQQSIRQRLTPPASVLSDVESSLCSTPHLGSHIFSLLPIISTLVHPLHPLGPKQIPSGDFWLQAGCLLSLPAGSIC